MVKPELEPIRRRKARRRAALAMVLALGAHGVIALLLAVASALWPAPPPERSPQEVSLRALTPGQWAANRAVSNSNQSSTAESSRFAPPEEKKQEPDKKPPGQVVDVAPGNDQEAKDARYAATSNNKVEHETRARDQTPFYKTAMPQLSRQTKPEVEGHDPVDRVMRKGNFGVGQDDLPAASAVTQKGAMEIPSMQKRDEVRLRLHDQDGPGAEEVAVANRAGHRDLKGNSDRLMIRPGTNAGGDGQSAGMAGAPGLANLTPSPGALNKIAGAAPNDYLDLDEGEGTFLNTKEWKYSGFFNRVKQTVGTQWDPGTVLHVRDPTGNIYGGHDRFTMVQVTLDDQGTVKNVSVEKSCGVDFLDMEAVHSFERVSRFPNPPPGLLEADAKVRFEFGFFIDYSGGARVRLFRQQN